MSAASGTGSGAASSRIRCALVPLMPNEDTPARRGRPGSPGHGRASVSRRTEPVDQSTCDDGSSTCSVFGSTPWRSADTILIVPVTPAAAWACPMLDFTEPSHSGRSSGCAWPYVASRAWASIGSPRVVPVPVPVPWPSTASTSAGVSRASARAGG